MLEFEWTLTRARPGVGKGKISMAKAKLGQVKEPAIFLAQFVGLPAIEKSDTLEGLAKWAAGLGYKGIQIPADHDNLLNVTKIAAEPAYAQEMLGQLREWGVVPTELSFHLSGQCVAVQPVYYEKMDAFAPEAVRGNPQARGEWAKQRVKLIARASKNLGLKAAVGFSGSLLWPFFYPWPPRSEQEVEEGFEALADLWWDVLIEFYECGVRAAFELHPGEDLHDGESFDRFLSMIEMEGSAEEAVAINYDPSHFVLQYMDEVGFIEAYHEYIAAAHIKDAELRRGVRSGVYGGYMPWVERPGRFRSLGDGQVRFKEIFSAFAELGLDPWPVVEWECCLKDPIVGATEGVEFVKRHTIPVTTVAFDDFAAERKEPEVA